MGFYRGMGLPQAADQRYGPQSDPALPALPRPEEGTSPSPRADILLLGILLVSLTTDRVCQTVISSSLRHTTAAASRRPPTFASLRMEHRIGLS